MHTPLGQDAADANEGDLGNVKDDLVDPTMERSAGCTEAARYGEASAPQSNVSDCGDRLANQYHGEGDRDEDEKEEVRVGHAQVYIDGQALDDDPQAVRFERRCGHAAQDDLRHTDVPSDNHLRDPCDLALDQKAAWKDVVDRDEKDVRHAPPACLGRRVGRSRIDAEAWLGVLRSLC